MYHEYFFDELIRYEYKSLFIKLDSFHILKQLNNKRRSEGGNLLQDIKPLCYFCELFTVLFNEKLM